jgi:hypothetical protein
VAGRLIQQFVSNIAAAGLAGPAGAAEPAGAAVTAGADTATASATVPAVPDGGADILRMLAGSAVSWASGHRLTLVAAGLAGLVLGRLSRRAGTRATVLYVVTVPGDSPLPSRRPG